jgi:hypothetical protein
MKKNIFLVFGLMLVISAFAQKPAIEFEKKVHDFGRFNEDGGNVTYEFKFTNNGATPLVINRVTASCGCTTPDWTKQPIMPGKTGSITAVYNPLGRPGVFTKSITVFSNATEEQVNLLIKGDVIPRGRTTTEEFPATMGDLRLKSKLVRLNNVFNDKSASREIELKNTGKSSINLSTDNLPAYLTAEFYPKTLAPNQEGKVIVRFDATKYQQWGPLSYPFYLVLNGQRRATEEFQILLTANVVEDFSRLTREQRAASPIFEVATRTIDMGVLKVGTKKTARLKVNNKGVNKLEIRRVLNNNKEYIVRPDKASIASGRSHDLVVELDTKGLSEGDYKKSFSLQTNDPDNSFAMITVAWKVVK